MSYAITTKVWYMRDEESPEDRLAFHVKTGDCFAMLATKAGLIEDALEGAKYRNEPPGASALMLLDSLRADLLQLQNLYQIKRRIADGER